MSSQERTDSVRAPIAVAERPAGPEISGRRTVWDRPALFASGALTLPELLELVPGVSVVRSGFIAAVTATSWYGEPGRVRVFLDGVELDPLDPRVGGSPDLGTIPIFALEEVAVERSAGELRVFLRSWRVHLTTAQTRTDILTGTGNTNLYRGFFGKRLNRGAVLQVAAQQYSTTNQRTRGDGDGLAAFVRVGHASGRLSVDATAHRYGRTRNPTRRYVLGPSPEEGAIGGFVGRDLAALVRAAWGNADSNGVWWQVIAATVQHVEDDSLRSAAATPDPDTVVTQGQYVGAIGVTRGALRLSATGRMRTQAGEGRFSPAVRAAWDARRMSVSAHAEGAGPDSTVRVDVLASIEPFDWLHVGAALSQHRPEDAASGGPDRTTVRGEVGLQVLGRWLTGGVIGRSAAQVPGVPAFDTLYTSMATGSALGREVGISGPIVGPFSVHARVVDWGEAGVYRPRWQSRTELRVVTKLKRYLPKADFELIGALIHEYRSDFQAPNGNGGIVWANEAYAFSSLLDIKISDAHIFWYTRNYTGKVYETVPGYLMPRLVQLYGVRWEFWN
ncbi:MAG: TonB-dependent receptor plug domain-containing protein [Gemmatimonadaceae bacterium]